MTFPIRSWAGRVPVRAAYNFAVNRDKSSLKLTNRRYRTIKSVNKHSLSVWLSPGDFLSNIYVDSDLAIFMLKCLQSSYWHRG